jgi:hypothetical protein
VLQIVLVVSWEAQMLCWKTNLSILGLSVLAFAFFFWSAVPSVAAASMAKCETSELTIPDLDGTALGEGEHVIGEAQTPRGKLEVRVSVKNKVISDPTFLIGGKRLKKTKYSKVPKDIRACLKEQSKKSAITAYQKIAFADQLQHLYSPRLDVAFRGRCKVTASCSQYVCCALAICGPGVMDRAVECVGF